MSYPGQHIFFHDGETYKISSVVDGTVIDLNEGKTKEGTKLINWDWTGSGNQRWIASTEGSGYRLEPTLPMKGKLVLDLDTSKQLVNLFGFHGKVNQQWVTEQVPNENGAIVIINLSNGTCLRNMGHGKQVKCSPKAFEDKSLWWIMTRV